MKNLLLFCLGLSLGHPAIGQKDGLIYMTHSSLLSGIKLMVNGNEKKMPWCGGMNMPQFATPDLNKDGKNDLVIYERYWSAGERGIKTFINGGTAGNPSFRYSPEYEFQFPSVHQFLNMQDYNCDGIIDLFHFGTSGVGVCDGFYTTDDKLGFKNCRDIKFLYPGASMPSNIGVSANDIPAIVDVDYDGDLDILTFAQLGSRIEMYRNLKKENSFGCDTFGVRLKDFCWGRVLQANTREHWLHISCDNSILGTKTTKTTDGSNTLCLFDADGDGDYDVLNGNSQYSDLQFMRNNRIQKGDKLDSMTSQDTAWQSGGKKLHLPKFPNANWIDIDLDGDKDILVSPTVENAENYKVVHFYKNLGNDNNPDFAYQKDTLFVEDMLDLGSHSYPILYDFNRDGKKDLFVGSRGFYQPGGTFRSTLAYFENTSTGTDVSFNLVAQNFLSIDSMTIEGAAPAVGDINNDGLDDLILGRLDGTVTYYQNIAASAAAQPVWQLAQKKLTDGSAAIDAGSYAAPLIYDIDNDGKKDILIGNQSGYISFYKNAGSTGQPGLQYVTNKLGNAKVVPDQLYSYSAPFIGKMDNTNKEYLLVGSGFGAIYRFDGFQNGNVTSPYTVLDSQYSFIQVPGRMISPIADDLDGDGKYEMLVGNDKGGLFYYKQMWNVNISDPLGETSKLELYPNPAGNSITLKADGIIPAGSELRVLNSMGITAKVINISTASDMVTLDLAGLASGVYLCTIRANGVLKSARFTKLN
jgi:hypothetical protein